jgi:hypothetical protein
MDFAALVAPVMVEFDGKTHTHVGNAAEGTDAAFLIEENERSSFINSLAGPTQGTETAGCWTVICGTRLHAANVGTFDPANGSIKLLEEDAAFAGSITFPLDACVNDGWLRQLLGGSGNVLVHDVESDESPLLLQTFDAGLPCGAPAAALPPPLQNHPNTGPIKRPLGLAS